MVNIQKIAENVDFIAINKPAGMLVYEPKIKKKDPKKPAPETVVKWLLEHYPEVRGVGEAPEERPGIVHRLDAETSGVLVIVKNQPFFDYLKQIFQNHEVEKTYMCLVYGRIEEAGVINKPIGLVAGSTKRSTKAKHMKMIKDAVTEYEPLENFIYKNTPFTYIRVVPRTGRTHQIRVHLASKGHGVVGDKLYGPSHQIIKTEHQLLHAAQMKFKLPNGQEIKLEAPLREEITKIIERLRKQQ